jgi:uncharacterized protein (TIGR04255 family)
MVQVSPNLLAINHLRPYPGWNAYLPIVMQALRTYREIAEPNGIQRIGLRYINRFLFSAGHIELKDFFDFYPHVGPRLPQDYGGFLAGVHMAFDEGRDVIRLQMTDADADRPGELAVVLDLDYYLNKAGGVSLDDVAVWLENAHLRIEQAFEGCVKAPLRERFYEEGNQP